jgi:uncharacterized protein YejL (UPF0352 family)
VTYNAAATVTTTAEITTAECIAYGWYRTSRYSANDKQQQQQQHHICDMLKLEAVAELQLSVFGAMVTAVAVTSAGAVASAAAAAAVRVSNSVALQAYCNRIASLVYILDTLSHIMHQCFSMIGVD